MKNLIIAELKAGSYSYDDIDTVIANFDPDLVKWGRIFAISVINVHLINEMQLFITDQGDDYLVKDFPHMNEEPSTEEENNEPDYKQTECVSNFDSNNDGTTYAEYLDEMSAFENDKK